MIGIFIFLAFNSGERHPVICRHHNDGICQLSSSFQLIDHALKVPIKIFDLIRVIQHICANCIRIWPKRRNLIYIRESLISLFQTRLKFIRTVRFCRPKPKNKGLIFISTVQKIGKVFSIIIPIYLGGWSL